MDKTLLSGLESMGLGNMSKLNLFDDAKEEKPEAKKPEPVKVDERTLILDKTCKCPVCDHEFKAKVVKTGKTKLITQDVDLRPVYSDVDSLKYGVCVCPICGYASMMKTFPNITSAQAKLIKEQISASFTGLGPDHDIYSYDDAITRHKLALVNTVVKRAKTSERAYMCLLLAWLLRGKRESLPDDTQNIAVVYKNLETEEKDFLAKARVGFEDAFSKENFPLCGLDECTSIYLIAALAAEVGDSDAALRWVSRLITSQSANDRIKERGRSLKEMIQNGVL